MGLVSPNGSKIDFMGEPIFESVRSFFVIILKFIFTPIFEIQIHEKKFIDTKKLIFESRFSNLHLFN